MSTPRAMPPLRRRIPGMTAPAPTPALATTENEPPNQPRGELTTGGSVVTPNAPTPATMPDPTPADHGATSIGEEPAVSTAASPAAGARRRSEDYSTTRLVNFRLPVDLHDRYRRLLVEVEQRHPRIRRPSLTDVIIALLEEGPGDSTELSELIRRKRADEYSAEER
jgi:hypothetical protein